MNGACQARERAPGRYQPRRPSESVLCRCAQKYVETGLAHGREAHDDTGPVPQYVEREFRCYLDCGILARGFARAGRRMRPHLKASRVRYEVFIYPKTEHGFNNDTSPRYDKAAARLAWQRTIAFLK